nr:hypothetical protein [Candidatus Sigynarchaeum springense]MDO8117423.1 hypothetical protein [Candidatus Sigynarchaeota archaeon]
MCPDRASINSRGIEKVVPEILFPGCGNSKMPRIFNVGFWT